MPSLLTKTAIWNMALDHLREQPLSDVTDSTPAARWLSRNYDHMRDFLLERMHWKFAMKREALPADPINPAWGWAKRYLLPTDCLRFVPPTIDGEWMADPISYEIESGYLLCDAEAPLRLRYVRRVENEGEFSNGFAEVLTLRLARRMSHWMTGKDSYVARVDAMMKEAWEHVRETEAVTTATGKYYDSDIATGREQFF